VRDLFKLRQKMIKMCRKEFCSISISIGHVISIISFTLVCCLAASAAASTLSPPISLDPASFDYHPGQLSGKLHKNSSSVWSPVSISDFSELSHHNEVWFRIALPGITWREPAINLAVFLNHFEIYLEDRLIYSYGSIQKPYTFLHDEGPDLDFSYHMSHFIPLEGAQPGMDLYLRILYPSRAGIGEVISLTIGSASDVIENMISERDELFTSSLMDVCLGFLLFVTGAANLFIFILRSKERDYPFLSFGFFSLSVGATYLSDFNSLFFLNLSPQTHFYLKSISFLLVPAGLFGFVGHMFHTAHTKIVSSMWRFHLFFALIAPFLISYNIDYTLFILGVITVNCSICIWIVFKIGSYADIKIRATFIGFLILFIILIVLHLLEMMTLLPVSFDFFGWGMLLFVFALGYALVQHYTNTFHKMQNVSLELEKKKSELFELQKENLRSQLEALKNQIDPHFLFNSFSTLALIIEENPETAVSFVEELSNVYRYVLKMRADTPVILKEELDFINSYRFLMAKRFGESLILSIEIPDIFYSYLVMPLSLQLLVENAIKHNIISMKKPLTIEVCIKEGRLAVINRLQKKSLPERTTHIGLENIKNRYRLVSEQQVVITQTESEFMVQIPLLT